MEGVFLEFENENALRTYPFASGCLPIENGEACIPAGVFVDAALYPVNPTGTMYLSSISESGVFSISDSAGVIMHGSASGSLVELYDTTEFARHVGTLVASSEDALSELAGRGVLRSYSVSETAFAASCVFPVVIDGVTAMSVGDSGLVSGSLEFANSPTDEVRVSSGMRDDGRRTLRFDVIPKIDIPAEPSIRRIICVVDGQTPFRILRNYDEEDGSGYNIVILSLSGIERDAVCSAAHRENAFVMADTCDCGSSDPEPCEKPNPDPEELPTTYQLIEVFIPPDATGAEGGLEDGADNAFYLSVPNLTGYVNPLSLTMEDGMVAPMTTDPEVVLNGDDAELSEGALRDEVTSKGLILQVPGLSGGEI